MTILIDGYNVLRAVLRGKRPDEHVRDGFIHHLNRYAAMKHHTIVLIFDGGSSGWQSEEQHGKVRVVFSGFKQTADDSIKDMVKKKRFVDALLVSSDHGLADYVSRKGVASIGGYTFYCLLTEALGDGGQQLPDAQSNAVKLSHQGDQQLDALMERTVVDQKPDDKLQNPHAVLGQGEKLSKLDQILMQKLKKL